MKIEIFPFKNETDVAIITNLKEWWKPMGSQVAMEHVWAMPGQNLNQMKMVSNHNLVKGAMISDARYDPTLHIIPAKWQQHHNLGNVYTGNVSKTKAYQMRKKAFWEVAKAKFPNETILKPTADAFLIALYAFQIKPGYANYIGIDPGMSGCAVKLIPEIHFSEAAYYPGLGFVCQEDEFDV